MSEKDPIRRFADIRDRRNKLDSALDEFASRLEAIAKQIRKDPAHTTPTDGQSTMPGFSDAAFPPPEWGQLDNMLREYQRVNDEYRNAEAALSGPDRELLGMPARRS